MSGLLAFLLKIGFGGAVDKAIALLQHRAEQQGNLDRLKTEATIELAREAVKEVQIMADFNRAKLQFPWFWLFAALFIVPLGAWWTAVIADSIFSFEWSVANLPTPEMRDWAGSMISWLFYVGTTVGAIKAIR